MSVNRNVTVPVGSSASAGSLGPAGDARAALRCGPGALAQENGKVVGEEPFQFLGRGKGPVRHGAGGADAVDEGCQAGLLVGGGSFGIEQHRLTGGQAVLVLEAGDVHAGGDPAVALPVDADEHLALLEVGEDASARYMLPRRVGTGARLVPHRNQVQALDGAPGGRALIGQLLQVDEMKTRTRWSGVRMTPGPVWGDSWLAEEVTPASCE